MNALSHIWNRFNTRWILSGAITGILAGTVMIALACFAAHKNIGEWSQPFKLIAAACYGPNATYFGPLNQFVIHGAIIHYALSILFGVTFAQLVHEESSGGSLVVLGFVCGLVIWVFGSQLFLPSVDRTLLIRLPFLFSLLLHVIFGISFGVLLNPVRAHVGR